MDGGLVEAIFAAITVGDQQALELCMASATIATVLEFETIYGESPLHLCVKLGGVSQLGLVRCLLATGLVDFDQGDSEGQTVLEYVHMNEDLELLEGLINVETECLDNVTACYKMMKHNSLDLFKLFLSIKKIGEDEMFKSIASALVKLNVKNFVLSEDLNIFVLWMLSDYGFRNLSGDWPGTKIPSEWKQHIGVIGECWRVIIVKYDTRMYGDVDDQLLHRLHVIHNYLYFLKHKQFLSHLPMQEVVFCVAMFISVFKNSAQFNDYRLVINKCLVIDMLRMVYRQLQLIKNHLETVEKELTEIIKETEDLDTSTKDRLIEKILDKIKSITFANKDHWIEETTKKIKTAQAMNRDALIKDMAKKIKSSDRTELSKEIQAIDEANKVHFIEEIRKRDLRVTHPQNVANRMMAGWKKGKKTDMIVAEIVSEESFNLKPLLRVEGHNYEKSFLIGLTSCLTYARLNCSFIW
uniref:ANK_REP_REGION domain-containing protein n=1 Tax=Anopheles atroparvus TaxID=41427 RepID=A0A182J6G2_ANOAO